MQWITQSLKLQNGQVAIVRELDKIIEDLIGKDAAIDSDKDGKKKAGWSW